MSDSVQITQQMHKVVQTSKTAGQVDEYALLRAWLIRQGCLIREAERGHLISERQLTDAPTLMVVPDHNLHLYALIWAQLRA